MTTTKRFVRHETQLEAGRFIFRASVFAEGTLEAPGEVWLSSSGWSNDPTAPYDWVESVYPELAAEWGMRDVG